MTAIDRVRVRGNATPEELAAVLATVARGAGQPAVGDPIERWRRARRAALRGTTRPPLR